MHDMVTLESIANIRLGMPFKSAINDVGDKGRCFLIQAKDIDVSGLIDFSCLTAVIPEGNDVKHYLHEDDILLRLRGPVFSAGIINEEKEKPIITSNQLAVIRCNKKIINPYYLHWYLNSKTGQNELKGMSEGTGITKINLKRISLMAIKLTSIENQNKIGLISENWLNQKKIYSLLIGNGDLLFNGICENLVSDVGDNNV